MAKSYYSLEEARNKLGMSETQIKGLVRSGKLREFRDSGKVNYRVDDVEKLAGASGGRKPPAAASAGSGELVLEPAEDSGIDLASTTGSQSGIDLASTGSDAISLAETDADATAVGGVRKKDKKEDTVITSVGVSVFEDDDADIMAADPVAETVVSDGGLGIEGIGSGSGLLDLTRESDDTSLGAELLDEISPGEFGDGGDLGEATRAGLDGAVSGPAAGTAAVESVAEAAAPRGVVVTRVEYGPDPVSMGLTGLMGAGVLIMCFLGLTVAAMMRGAVPVLLEVLCDKAWIFGLASLAAAGIATGVGYFLGKRAEQS